jgi:hypothetical protein
MLIRCLTLCALLGLAGCSRKVPPATEAPASAPPSSAVAKRDALPDPVSDPAAVPSSTTTEQAPNTIQLAFAGQAYDASLAPRSGMDWYAITHTTTGFSLVKASLEARPEYDGCAESEVQRIATDVDKSVFMVRGLPALTEGPLDTVFSGYFPISMSGGINLALGSGVGFGLSARGKLVKTDVDGSSTRIEDYEVRWHQDRRTQSLYKLAGAIDDGLWFKLIWAGDLDRDGKPDVLLDVSPELGSHYMLFLSSLATGEKLVGWAADFHVSVC